MIGISLCEVGCDITAEWIEEYNDIRLQETWDNLVLYQYATEKGLTFSTFAWHEKCILDKS